MRDIRRYRNAAPSQRIIQRHSNRGPVCRAPGRAYAPRLKPHGGIWRIRGNDESSLCGTVADSEAVRTREALNKELGVDIRH